MKNRSKYNFFQKGIIYYKSHYFNSLTVSVRRIFPNFFQALYIQFTFKQVFFAPPITSLSLSIFQNIYLSRKNFYCLEKKFYRLRNLLQKKIPAADTSDLALTGAYIQNLFPKKLEFSYFFGSNVLDFQKPQHVKYNRRLIV